ncbi:MAG: metallophosphoesterase [Melioribacteraceae bacterium]|nr:metallophosphoesterase [Melioribacteraceae bacterium]
MRIAHISDLHISLFYKKENVYKTQKAFENILNQDVDHIIITGDISDNAEWKEFLVFRNILKNLDLLDSKKTTLIIGNHDIFGGVRTAEDVISFPSKCRNINYEEAILRFTNYYIELFDDVKFLNPKSFFPFIKTIDEYCILGINSIDKYSTFRNPFASNGYIADNQFKLIKEKLKLNEYKDSNIIAAVHHHFYKANEETTSSASRLWDNIEKFTMKLRKKKRIIKLFSENNINLVLHGHSHEMKTYKRKEIQFVNAGASIDNKLHNASYYLIDLVDNDFTIRRKSLEIEENFNNRELSAKEIIYLAG